MIIMSEDKKDLEGVCALAYTALWQTRELGFLKQILTSLNIKQLKILFYLEEYLPGALITLDGEAGDFKIEPVNSPDDVEYDGAIIGKIAPLIKALEGNVVIKGLWILLSRKVKLKGKRNLLKFGRVILRGAV